MVRSDQKKMFENGLSKAVDSYLDALDLVAKTKEQIEEGLMPEVIVQMRRAKISELKIESRKIVIEHIPAQEKIRIKKLSKSEQKALAAEAAKE